jgi:hypothetical protein
MMPQSSLLVYEAVIYQLQDKRIFIKDMAYFIVPQHGSRSGLAASFSAQAATSTDQAQELNLSVLPVEVLRRFHFTFLIRHPVLAIPSYYRCTIPPKSEITGVNQYSAADTGYKELRQLFDYLHTCGIVGPSIAGRERCSPAIISDSQSEDVEICVIDAEDLLRHPESIVQQYCASTGLHYSGKDMLMWDTTEEHIHARDAFATWKGFHDDAINSVELEKHVKVC